MATNHITEVVRLYVEEGKSLRDIAGRVGTSYETVRTWLVHAGVTLRGRGGSKQKPIDRKIIEQLYFKDRLSISRMAEKLKVPRTMIESSLRDHGINYHNPNYLSGGFTTRLDQILNVS